MTFVLALKAVGARPWRHAFCTRTKNRLQSKSVKNRAYSVFTQRIYASGGVFEPRAERACLVQPRDAVARSLKSARHCLLEEGVGRCGAVRGAGASQSARWLRADRALRHGPLARHGSRCWASGRQLGRRRILGRLAGGRRGAAWPLMHSAPACWRPTRRCLASNGTRRCLAGNRPTRSCVASDGKHTRTQTRSSRTHTDALVPNAARTELVPRR